MLPPPDPSVLANNPNFANLYNHLTTHILTPEGSTLANVAEHNSTSSQLNEARATAIQDELLLCMLEELVSPDPDPTHDSNSNTSKPSQLPRKTGESQNPYSQQPPNTRSNAKVNLPPDLHDLVFNITSYLSTSLQPESTLPLSTDIEDLLTDELNTFQSSLPTIGPVLSTHLINTERTLSNLLTSTNRPSSDTSTSNPTTITQTPTKPFRRTKPTTQSNLATHLTNLTTQTTQLQHSTLPQTLTSTLTTLLTALSTHHTSTLSQIRTLEQTTHGTTSRHLTARSIYLSTVARGINLKTRLLSLEREKEVYGDEEGIERVEGEVERLVGEERRLKQREEELVGLLGEYEGEGGKVGGSIAGMGMERGVGMTNEVGPGEQVFRVLGERYREVEEEIEVVKRDIERLETRVWRGR